MTNTFILSCVIIGLIALTIGIVTFTVRLCTRQSKRK